MTYTARGKSNLVDESDRGCVLVGAAILEEHLEEIFRCLFRFHSIETKIQDSLFDANGPLATYSSKARLCHAIGLIPAGVYQDLDAIRKLRNKVAHTPTTFDFDEVSVGRIVESLNCVQPDRNRLQRYSPVEQVPEPAEARLRVAGFIKYRKSLFVFGIKQLEIELLKSQHRLLTHGSGNEGETPRS